MNKNGVKEYDILEDGSRLYNKSIEQVLNESMLPYAEAVIMDRALPRVEDGLKPVQRRILYTMHELGLSPESKYLKSARIVGDCMGKYHPHGDSSVYQAMVRMAQDFNMSVTLVEGQGNFGSIDGDGAAAMRYTEAKMTPLAMEMLKDLNKSTLDWSRNYDDSCKEPNVLPGRFPNLLVNGASGIAVGLATNIPPHNICEAIEGVIQYIDNPKISLDEMMKYIKGPDFPSGCIVGTDGLYEAYKTGKGSIIMRSVMHIESDKNDRKSLVITKLPYQVNKSELLVKIIKLREANKDFLGSISDVVDESDKEGMRAVIKFKKDADYEKIIEFLIKNTELEKRFSLNMVAIANGRPKQLGLIEIIKYYSVYQHQVVLNRSKYELEEAKDREHILQGLVIAVLNIDEVIAIIRKSENVTQARNSLKTVFDLTDRQAQAILDLRLARLTKLEIEVLRKELSEIEQRVRRLTAIINSKKLLSDLVKMELTQILRAYRTERRSMLIEDASKTKIHILSNGESTEECVIALSQEGKLKRLTKAKFGAGYRTANDGLVKSIELRANENVLLVTDSGNCINVQANKIPVCEYTDGGVAVKSICKDAQNEIIVAMFKNDDELLKKEVLIYTSDGNLKKSNASILKMNKEFYKVMITKDKAKVIGAEICDDSKTIMYLSDKGLAVNFNTDEMNMQGRNASGSRAMNIGDEDEVVFASQVDPNGELAILTSNGMAKKIRIKELGVMTRGRKGVKICELDEADKMLFAGDVTKSCQIAVYCDDDWFVVSSDAFSLETRIHKGRILRKNAKINKAVVLV